MNEKIARLSKEYAVEAQERAYRIEQEAARAWIQAGRPVGPIHDEWMHAHDDYLAALSNAAEKAVTLASR